MTTLSKLAQELIKATVIGGHDGSWLVKLDREHDLLAAKNRKSIRQALAYFQEVQDRGSRNMLFCFLWEKSGHDWDIPVTMTTIRG